jgi:hypothetical protein
MKNVNNGRVKENTNSPSTIPVNWFIFGIEGNAQAFVLSRSRFLSHSRIHDRNHFQAGRSTIARGVGREKYQILSRPFHLCA